MSNFKGYLFKAVKTGQEFPNKYIAYESWSSTPKQREEIKAYRDDNSRALYRITAEGKKSIFSFETREGLHLADKLVILNFFYNAEVNSVERKIQLEYWNEESSVYDTGYFYRPNMEFKIRKITDDDIIYQAMSFNFIEY